MTNNIIIWSQGMRRDHCRYCGVPFNEIPESMSNPGVCEFCAERKSAIGEVNHLKSVFVNMDKFKGCRNYSSLMVIEWPNADGVDVYLHPGIDKRERRFELSYDEFEALINAVYAIDESKVVVYSDKNYQ